MATRRPLVLVSGIWSELPLNDAIDGGAYQLNTITAGSGLAGGGTVGANTRFDISLVPNASGLFFDANSRLGINGGAIASGNAALSVGVTALASGNAALTVGTTALASGNAALVRGVNALALTGGTMQGGIVGSGNTVGAPAYRTRSDSGLYGSGHFVGVSSSGIGALLVGSDFVQVEGDNFQIKTSRTPASATASGTIGQIAWDTSYIYICTATNTWRRVGIAPW